MIYQHDAARWQQLRDACFEITSVVDTPTANLHSPGWAVLGSPNGTAVVIEGTISGLQLAAQSAETELQIAPRIPGRVMRFHRRVNDAIYENIRSAVAATTGPITVTGHSLGGAVAVNVAWLLKQDFPGRSVRVLSYGAPRGGNPQWSGGLVTLQPIRVENWDDPVPHIPPPTLVEIDLNVRLQLRPSMMTYTHAGHAWRLKQDGSIEIFSGDWGSINGWYPPRKPLIPQTDPFALDRGHWTSEYVRRTRQRVHVTGGAPDAYDHCMHTLDAINNALNDLEGRGWDIDAETGVPANWVNGPPPGEDNWWQGFLDGKPKCYPGG